MPSHLYLHWLSSSVATVCLCLCVYVYVHLSFHECLYTYMYIIVCIICVHGDLCCSHSLTNSLSVSPPPLFSLSLSICPSLPLFLLLFLSPSLLFSHHLNIFSGVQSSSGRWSQSELERLTRNISQFVVVGASSWNQYLQFASLRRSAFGQLNTVFFFDSLMV